MPKFNVEVSIVRRYRFLSPERPIEADSLMAAREKAIEMAIHEYHAFHGTPQQQPAQIKVESCNQLPD